MFFLSSDDYVWNFPSDSQPETDFEKSGKVLHPKRFRHRKMNTRGITMCTNQDSYVQMLWTRSNMLRKPYSGDQFR